MPAADPAPDDLRAHLDDEQWEVASAIEGPVRVLAGAGTGKTRAVTYRIAHAVRRGAHDPRRTLALTFTARAAGELRDRLARLGVEGVAARTFHAAALRQLRYFWPRVGPGDPPELLASKSRMIAEAATRCRVSTDPAVVRDLAAEIEWAKVSEVAPSAYVTAAAERSTAIEVADIAAVYAAYQELAAARAVMDFEDVLLTMVGLLEQRSDIAAEVRSAYRWFTVDEYQDVSPLQQHLLDLWVGDRDEVCVVGDAAQTIYTFAGATPRFLLDFGQRHTDAQTLHLVRSYRSTPQIVAAANAALSHTTAPQQVSGAWRVTLQSSRPTGPAPRVRSYDDESAEAAGVARRIRELVRSGVPAREIGVLFRIHALSPAYEAALDEAGIPYSVRGSDRFFERAEVREAITRLRGAAKAAEVDADPAAPDPGALSAAEQAAAVLSQMGWTPVAPTGLGAVREKWESLAAVVSLAAAAPSLAALVAELDRRAQFEHPPTSDAVTLSSLHAAKGLEWEAVFLVGLAEGTLPIALASTPERIEEERRLFYVGITRARTHLEMSWARSRFGRAGRTRSRFIDELRTGDDSAIDLDAASAQAGERSGARSRSGRRAGPALAKCRGCGKGLATGAERARGRCRTCPGTPDEHLLDALKAWRLAEAQRLGVPAYVIFTDATLEAIAEVRPQSDDALLAIPGIGAAKLAKHGESVVALIRGAEPAH